MKIALASDHAGYQLKEYLKEWLNNKGYKTEDFGTQGPESTDYPDYARPAAESVADGRNDYGIIICGTGTGMCIVSNKVRGIRAANCLTVEMAVLAREHNNANVLNLGARLIDSAEAARITEAFLITGFTGGRHQRRIDKIE